jgi:hypothetical protein
MDIISNPRYRPCKRDEITHSFSKPQTPRGGATVRVTKSAASVRRSVAAPPLPVQASTQTSDVGRDIVLETAQKIAANGESEILKNMGREITNVSNMIALIEQERQSLFQLA